MCWDWRRMPMPGNLCSFSGQCVWALTSDCPLYLLFPMEVGAYIVVRTFQIVEEGNELSLKSWQACRSTSTHHLKEARISLGALAVQCRLMARRTMNALARYLGKVLYHWGISTALLWPFFYFWNMVSHIPLIVLELARASWPQTSRNLFACLLSAGIKVIHYSERNFGKDVIEVGCNGAHL